MDTIKQTIKKVFMQELIPEQHVGVIERDGQINRLVEPGYVTINRYSERIVQVVKVGPQQAVIIDLAQVRSADGFPVDIRCRIGWGFDPQRCNFKLQPHLIRNAPEAQTIMLKNTGERIARDVVGTFNVEELPLGTTQTEIGYQIKAKLYREVRQGGIILFPVTVEHITPPAELDNALRTAHEKRVLLDIQTYEKQKLAEIAATETRILAEAEVYQRNLQIDASAREKELLTKVIATEMEWHYKWLASIDPELAKQITHTEAFKTVASNGGSINLYSPLAASWHASLLPLFGQPVTVNGNGHHNGKEL